MIETLPLLTPDPHRTRRTVQRCHQRLARRPTRPALDAARPGARYLAVERVLIGSLCVFYMTRVALVAIDVLIGR